MNLGASTRIIAKRKHYRVAPGLGACGATVGGFYADWNKVTCPVCLRELRKNPKFKLAVHKHKQRR